MSDPLVARALAATRESRRIRFRPEFQPEDLGQLLYDIAAMANSGGGVIVVGLGKDGAPSGWKPVELSRARITAALEEHADEPFDEFEVAEVKKGRRRLTAIRVFPRTGPPIMFAGTMPFRHGTKSAPGSSLDLSRFIEREVDRRRREWSKDIRKVVAAPKGSEVLVVKPRREPPSALARVRASASPATTEVRVVDDPTAPAVARTDFDLTHPYRQNEIIRAFNTRSGRAPVTAYDMLCVRRVHGIDEREEFFHRPKFGSPQYSEQFLKWLLAQPPAFFDEAKAAYRDLRQPRV